MICYSTRQERRLTGSTFLTRRILANLAPAGTHSGCTCLDPFHPTSAPTRKRASISSRPASKTKRMRACSISARQLSRNHELTRTSAPLSSMAASIQAHARSSLQPIRERNVRDSFSEGQHRIPSCFTSRTRHYDPARAETVSVTSMWRQGVTGFRSAKLRAARRRCAG